ncbi:MULTISPECIES: hypothetical protein [Saccharopolyspora]|uniref:Uncharacterized protein n=1 Tax=Saccharopolyspora cebuensis TaxID=418759 RepID=A0ABV4CBJ3_9PSEU
MRRLRSALRHFARLPRGYAADGRLLGLGLATAMESSRRSAGGDRPVAVPAQRTPR